MIAHVNILKRLSCEVRTLILFSEAKAWEKLFGISRQLPSFSLKRSLALKRSLSLSARNIVSCNSFNSCSAFCKKTEFCACKAVSMQQSAIKNEAALFMICKSTKKRRACPDMKGKKSESKDSLFVPKDCFFYRMTSIEPLNSTSLTGPRPMKR